VSEVYPKSGQYTKEWSQWAHVAFTLHDSNNTPGYISRTGYSHLTPQGAMLILHDMQAQWTLILRAWIFSLNGVLCPNEFLPALVDPVRFRVAVTASSTTPATPLMTAQTPIDATSSDTISEEVCILMSAFVARVWTKVKLF